MRDDRIWPNVYFGRPGALTTLPYPRGGIDPTYERAISDFVTGSGAHRIGKLAQGSRVWSLVWNALQIDTYSLIESYTHGHNGTGPWALIDPSRINLLTVNQSAVTALLKDVTGFTTASSAHGTPFSNTATSQIHRVGAQRSLEWRFTVSPTTTPVMTLSSVYSGWYGIPVVPGKSYAFSAWMKPDGTVNSSITVAVKMRWLDSANGQVSTDVTSGDITVTGWTKLTATGTCPAGVAYVAPRFVATGSSITTGGSLFIDEMQLEEGTSSSTWVPGTGVYPVETLDVSETVPFAAAWRTGPTLTVREVVS